jgi:hypothetical protein
MDSKKHYHIRWWRFDWEPLPTSEEARKLAEQIKRPNESYVIDESDDQCDICTEFKSKIASNFFNREGDKAVQTGEHRPFHSGSRSSEGERN